MEENGCGSAETSIDAPLRRVISECDDCDMENVVVDVRIHGLQNTGRELACGLVEPSVATNINFGYGSGINVDPYENERVMGVNPDSGMSDISLSTRLDPSDAGAPLTIIEGYSRCNVEVSGNVNDDYFDDNNNKYEDSSSLSCDGSEETPVDINNMILLHELHGTTSTAYRNNNDTNNSKMAVDPRLQSVAPTILKKYPQQNQQLQIQPSSVTGDCGDVDNTMTGIDEGLTSNDSYESGSHASSSQRAPSSQTSDWGYFEDVHQSNEGHTTNNINKISNSNKKSRKMNTMIMTTGNNVPSTNNGNNRGNTIPVSSSHHHHHHHSNKISNDAVLAAQDADGIDISAMAVTAPTYVLEESISSQLLWKYSAGQRPIQPFEERAFYEKMWAQNFARSQVNYKIPVEVLTRPSPISLNPFADSNFDTAPDDDHHHDYSATVIPPDSGGTGASSNIAEAALANRMNNTVYPSNALTMVHRTVKDSAGEGDLTVLVRGDNVFGTTVSKSFARAGSDYGPPTAVDTVNISIASYRVVRNKKHVKYAQFLVIYREGSIRDTVGVWKRYRDFEELANKVTQAHEQCSLIKFANNISPLAMTSDDDDEDVHDSVEAEQLPNAVTSWRLLKKRQRWYRCLDAGYLSLKVFLLERFLHDILFESSSPLLLQLNTAFNTFMIIRELKGCPSIDRRKMSVESTSWSCCSRNSKTTILVTCGMPHLCFQRCTSPMAESGRPPFAFID